MEWGVCICYRQTHHTASLFYNICVLGKINFIIFLKKLESGVQSAIMKGQLHPKNSQP